MECAAHGAHGVQWARRAFCSGLIDSHDLQEHMVAGCAKLDLRDRPQHVKHALGPLQ